MCTLAALVPAQGHGPIVIAANRDEMLDRPALRLGRHWPGRPWRGGKDALAGGTWAGVHDEGFGVFVLNRERSLGPEPGKRSRGLLALDLLAAGSHEAAERHALELSPGDYRPFHAVIASGRGVTGVTGGGGDPARTREAPPGVTLWTASGPNTDASARQVAHRNAFGEAWRRWTDTQDLDSLIARLEALLAAPPPPGGSPFEAMCIHASERGFGTRSSLVVAFAPRPAADAPSILRLRVANGPPDDTAFEPA